MVLEEPRVSPGSLWLSGSAHCLSLGYLETFGAPNHFYMAIYMLYKFKYIYIYSCPYVTIFVKHVGNQHYSCVSIFKHIFGSYVFTFHIALLSDVQSATKSLTKQTMSEIYDANGVTSPKLHDDVIKWKHITRYWPFVRGIHRSPVNFPHKGQWRGALMFSLIRAWLNGWVNNRQAGYLRRHRAHYDVTVMSSTRFLPSFQKTTASALMT